MKESTCDMSSDLQGLRILVVDDEVSNVRMLERMYTSAGYTNILGVTDPRTLVDLTRSFPPDLLLLDLRMPHLDGFQILERLAADASTEDLLPIIVLTADDTVQAKEKALSLGATEFITKPFHSFEILLRTRNLLRMRQLQAELQERNRDLSDRVIARTQDLERSQAETLDRLASAVEARDGETGEHTRRVGENSAELAGALGLSLEDVELIRRAAPLHDVGKIGIPDAVLLKRGRLTTQEFDIAKTHTIIGARLLSGGESDIIRMAERIARFHHERWGGGGYPQGLTGDHIPLEARIVAIVDVFDALTHDRPYRKAWPVNRVLTEIRAQAGVHFDPEIAAALLTIHSEGRLIL